MLLCVTCENVTFLRCSLGWVHEIQRVYIIYTRIFNLVLIFTQYQIVWTLIISQSQHVMATESSLLCGHGECNFYNASYNDDVEMAMAQGMRTATSLGVQLLISTIDSK